jgi:FKBP-type peptidyl-prolyl cis-trans isomerase SlpA
MAFSLRIKESGQLVDEASAEEPIEFVMGDGTLFEGLEQHLEGLEAGSEVDMILSPSMAFGEMDPEGLQWMEREMFGDLALEEGLVLGFDAPNGEDIPGTVWEISEDQVQINFNHPLAGRYLQFNVHILSVE